MTSLQAGIQLHLSVLKSVRLPELVELGKLAVAGGVTQLWVTDNLGNRNVFSVLAALAAKIPVSLGTAVAVPYFHNPVDIAGAAAAINEMMDGRELSLGIARGNPSTAGFVATPKPISVLRETAQSLNQLLSGEEVTFDAYPNLASYFNLNPSAVFRLSFTPPGSVRLYCGGNGPLSLAVGGQFMDGLIFGGTFQAVGLTGRLPTLLRTFDDAAEKAGKAGGQPKVAEIKLSVSQDAKAARSFVANSAGTRLLSLRERGFSEDEIKRTGVASEDLDRLEEARKSGEPRERLPALVTDAMIDAIFVAGDPADCRERMVDVCRLARDNGFQQLMFSELGPNPAESLRLLCDEILPAI